MRRISVSIFAQLLLAWSERSLAFTQPPSSQISTQLNAQGDDIVKAYQKVKEVAPPIAIPEIPPPAAQLGAVDSLTPVDPVVVSEKLATEAGDQLASVATEASSQIENSMAEISANAEAKLGIMRDNMLKLLGVAANKADQGVTSLALESARARTVAAFASFSYKDVVHFFKLETAGPWYVVFLALFFAISQRNLGSEAAWKQASSQLEAATLKSEQLTLELEEEREKLKEATKVQRSRTRAAKKAEREKLKLEKEVERLSSEVQELRNLFEEAALANVTPTIKMAATASEKVLPKAKAAPKGSKKSAKKSPKKSPKTVEVEEDKIPKTVAVKEEEEKSPKTVAVEEEEAEKVPEKFFAKKVEPKEVVKMEAAPPKAAKKAAPKAKKSTAKRVSRGNGDWSSLSASTLSRKTVKELVAYLAQKGKAITGDDGKTMRKAQLVEAIRSL